MSKPPTLDARFAHATRLLAGGALFAPAPNELGLGRPRGRSEAGRLAASALCLFESERHGASLPFGG